MVQDSSKCISNVSGTGSEVSEVGLTKGVGVALVISAKAQMLAAQREMVSCLAMSKLSTDTSKFQGFSYNRVGGFNVAVDVTEHKLSPPDAKIYVVGNSNRWRYTEPAPRGKKLTLLTRGGIQVTGEWLDDGSFIAWAPLIKRDHKLEKELGLCL